MNRTATRSRIRNFGTNDQRDQFATKYGSPDYAVVGAAIAAEQRKHNASQEATVTKPNRGTVETLYALAASRTPWVRDEQIDLYLQTASAKDVAERIDWLESQPVATLGSNTEFKAPVQDRPYKAPAEVTDKDIREVPEGRYAITGNDGATRFYKVDRPTEGRWAGYVFVKVQAGDELHNIRQRNERTAILARIAQDGVKEAMLRYGRELGHCGHCGRTLTNEESRELGIGPICRGKMGF